LSSRSNDVAYWVNVAIVECPGGLQEYDTTKLIVMMFTLLKLRF